MSILRDNCISILKENQRNLEDIGTIAVGLFGSFARDEHTSKSDFDVIVCVDDIGNEDRVSSYIKNILKPLGREVDVNFPTNIGIGNTLWANIDRDAILAFGELPKAKSRMERLNMKNENSNLVMLEMANRYPKFARFFKNDFENYNHFPEENKDLALRITQKIVTDFTPVVITEFFRNFDDTALDILGYNTVRVDPEKPGKDPRKKDFERDE